MQRIVAGIVLFVISTSTAEARRRPWDDEKKDAITIAAVLPDVPVIDPNARAEAEKQQAIDEAFLLIDLDAFSDAPGTMASRPDPSLLVAWRQAPPAAERTPDKVYLSAPAASTPPAK